MRITTLTKIIIFYFLLWNTPVFAATITVDSTADTVAVDGQCTLREAIANANDNTDTSGGDCAAGEDFLTTNHIDHIDFSVQKPATITLNSALLPLTDAVEIVNASSPNDLIVRRADSALPFSIFSVNREVGVTLEGLTVTNGYADEGGGVYVASYSMLTVVNCVISGNTSQEEGSAISGNTGSVVTVENSTIENNRVTDVKGFTIYNYKNILRVVNSTIADNQGTGIYCEGNESTIINSTISGNSGRFVKGIVSYSSVLNIFNSTIIKNTDTSAWGIGGGLLSNSSTINMYNTIVAGNSASGNSDISATLTDSSNNIIGDPEGCDGCENANNIIDIPDLSQILDTNLASNCAPNGLPKTHALIFSVNNPAIDGGLQIEEATTDQRGEFRTGHVDIGAFEYAASTYKFAQSAYTVLEGNSPHTFNDIKIICGGNSNLPAEIALSDGQTIAFAQGQSEQPVPIEILGNTTDEPDQIIDLSINSVSNGGIGSPATTTLTIQDDDVPLPVTKQSDDEPSPPPVEPLPPPVIPVTEPTPPVEEPDYFSKPTINSTLDFGNTLLNTGSEQTLLIENTGEKTLTVRLESLSSADFTIVSPDFPLRILVDEEVTVTLRCTPSEMGNRTAQLTFTTNDPTDSTVSYTLVCNGIAPVYDSNPVPDTTLDFGSVKIGETVAYELTVSEAGDAELRLETLKINDSTEFTSKAETPIIIPDGGKSKTVIVQCTPAVAGERTAVLTIETNDPNRPQVTYPLICNGLLDITTLTVETAEGGRIVSNPAGISCPNKCQAQFSPNTAITLSAKPDLGWQFVEWTGDCDETGHIVLDAERQCGARFTPRLHTFTLEIEGEGQVTSEPEGINCPDQCEGMFVYNTNLEFTVQPGDGYQAQWSEDCSENMTLIEDTTCTVQFLPIPVILPPKESILTVTIQGEGHVTECVGTCAYPADTALILTPKPADSYQFDGWKGDCDAQGNVTMTTDRTCTAVFSLVPLSPEETYTITVTVAPGGSVTVMPTGENYTQTFSKTYPAGTELYFKTTDYLANITEPMFIVKPNSNQQFNGWGGDCAGPSPVVLDRNLTCTVTFGTAQLTVKADGAGRVCVQGTSNCFQEQIFPYQAGEQLTLKAEGNQFSGWKGCQNTTNQTIVVGTDKSQICTAQFVADADGDFAPDAQEANAPNGGDGNGDGIPDGKQNNVVSLPMPSSAERYLTFETPPDCPIKNAKLEGGLFSNASSWYSPPTITFNTTCQKPRVSVYYHGINSCENYENRTLFSMTCATKVVGGKTVAVISSDITNENGVIRFGDLSFDTAIITLSENPEKFKCEENCARFEVSGVAVIAVKRRGSMKGIIKVDYETIDGTAKNGEHYKAVRGTLVWAENIINGYINIPIINNSIYEGENKTFTIRLSNLQGPDPQFYIPEAEFTILDDDCNPDVIARGKIDAKCVVEGDGQTLDNLTEVLAGSTLENVVIVNNFTEETEEVNDLTEGVKAEEAKKNTFENRGTITDSILQGKTTNWGTIQSSDPEQRAKMVVGQLTARTKHPLFIYNHGHIMHAIVGHLTVPPKNAEIAKITVVNNNVITNVTFGVTDIQIDYPFIIVKNQKNGIIANSTFENVEVENGGLIVNATVSEHAIIRGGRLQGFIKNAGTLEDITLETPIGGKTPSVIEGGTLRGYIVVNNGILRNVRLGSKEGGSRTLVYGGTLDGGTLEGTIAGEPEKPARLEEVTISDGAVLENVWIGNNVHFEGNITFGESVRFIGNTEPPCESVGKTFGGEDVQNYLTCKLITRHEQLEVPVTRRPNNMLALPCEEAYYLSISATLQIPPEQKDADIFIMATHNYNGEKRSYARNGEDWEFIKPQLAEKTPDNFELLPAYKKGTLSAQEPIFIYEEYLKKDLQEQVGKFAITIGHRLEDGTIVYSRDPIRIGFNCGRLEK